MCGNRDGLNTIEVNAALDFFTYYMDMRTRGLLMNAHPEIYNKLCGSEVVKVVRTADDTPVLTPGKVNCISTEDAMLRCRVDGYTVTKNENATEGK